MAKFKYIVAGLAVLILAWSVVTDASASRFDISGGDLKGALDTYARVTGVAVLYPATAIEGVRTKGVKGDLSDVDALSHILAGTGFVPRRHPDGTVVVVRDVSSIEKDGSTSLQVATAAAPSTPGAALETVTVTSSRSAAMCRTSRSRSRHFRKSN